MSKPFISVKLIYVRSTVDFVGYVLNNDSILPKLTGVRVIIVFQGVNFGESITLQPHIFYAIDREFHQKYPGHDTHWLRYKHHTHNHERLNMYLFEEKDINIKYNHV